VYVVDEKDRLICQNVEKVGNIAVPLINYSEISICEFYLVLA
jgi:hypothetical protein